jgi:uncharacterized protein (DUF2384 family)
MVLAQTLTDPGDAIPRSMPNLADEATRQRLTRSATEGVLRLAELWHLSSGEMCALLGAISERTWFRMKRREWPRTFSQDEMTRISALIGIFRGVRLLFSLPLADEWVRLPNNNPQFGGRRPLDVMIEGGIPVMLDVRRLVDALRGGL